MKTFRQRQFLMLLGQSLAPLAIITAIALPSARNSITQSTTAQLETVADLKTIQVNEWLDQGRETAQLVVELSVLTGNLPVLLEPDAAGEGIRRAAEAQLVRELELVAIVHEAVRSISLLHPTSGDVLLSTDPSQVGRVRRTEDYFWAGRQGLFISPVVYSVGREAPVLIISAPLRDERGSLLTVAAVELDLDDLNAALSGRSGLRQTGQAYLVESYGFYITPPSDSTDRPLSFIAESEGIQRALAGEDGSGEYANPQGIPVLGVYRWLPGAEMGLLVEITRAELNGVVRRTWIVVTAVGLALALLATLAARSLASWLVSPLEQITQATRALQSGDLSRRAPVSDPEEIRQLATAFNEMAASIQQKTDELSHSNVELEQFAYSVSHDLRAPLRAIDGFSRIVVKDYAASLPEEGQHYLNRVRENTRKMSQLIDDLLSLSRLGRQALDPRTISPADLAREVLDELRHEQKGRQIEVIIGELPTIEADLALFRQVFVNLLSNALKFTRQQEIARIEVGCQQTDGKEVYFVRDNGVGFDMRYADKLFGVFQRLHRAEEFDGTGVGLAIVQRAIHRHGGRIWAESEEGVGTTFYFTVRDDG